MADAATLDEASLPTLPDGASRRTRVAFEVLTTELTYRQGLARLIELFVRPLRARAAAASGAGKKILDDREINSIFLNIEPIHALSGELLGAFGAVLREWDDKSSRLGAVFLQYVPYLLIYSVYVNSFDSALARIAALGASNSAWAKFRSKAEGDARMAMLDLQAHLLLPVQRIPRYVLLLRDLLRVTPADHPDRADLEKALHSIEELAVEVNQRKRDADSNAHFRDLIATVDGFGDDFVQPHRRVLRLAELAVSGASKGRFKVALCNDLILFAKPKLLGSNFRLRTVVSLTPETVSFEPASDADGEANGHMEVRGETEKDSYRVQFAGDEGAVLSEWKADVEASLAHLARVAQDRDLARRTSEYHHLTTGDIEETVTSLQEENERLRAALTGDSGSGGSGASTSAAEDTRPRATATAPAGPSTDDPLSAGSTVRRRKLPSLPANDHGGESATAAVARLEAENDALRARNARLENELHTANATATRNLVVAAAAACVALAITFVYTFVGAGGTGGGGGGGGG